MDIFQVRFGLATNSSSTHSLVFLPENVKAVDHCGHESDEPANFGDFGWQNFTLTSTEGKMRYLAALLKERLYHELPQNIADTVIKSWLPDINYDAEDSIDHQSFMFLPSAHGTEIPDETFFNALKDFLLQDRLAILGGNDNETGSHYLDDGNAFKLPIPGGGVYRNNMVCRLDKKYGYWTIFNQEDGTKLRMRLENNPEHMKIKPEKAYAPELVDLKITDYCPYGCPYCYQGSTIEGKHVSSYYLSSLAEAMHFLGVFEVAIGGGEPTLHPDFPSILESFRDHGVIPNFTTRNIQWLRHPEMARRIIKACGSFGYSVTKGEEVHELKTLLEYNEFPIHVIKPNIHVVLGVVDTWKLGEILKATGECDFNTTLLSYKQVGRGENFQPQRIGDWIQIVKRHADGRRYGANIGIDTPLAAEYEEGLISQNVPKWMYETKEGGFSCYIDAVTEQIGPSSYCKPEQMLSVSPRHWQGDDQRELYEKIRDAFQSF